MKKILLASTALVAASTAVLQAASAAEWEIQLGGYYNGALGFAETDGAAGLDGNEANFGSDSEFHFRPSITLDNGLTFGADVELDLETNEDSTTRDLIDEASLFVNGSFGSIIFGQQDGAGYQFGTYYIPGIGGHSVNNNDENNMDLFRPYEVDTGLKIASLRNRITTQPRFTEDQTKITYFTPRFAGFQLGASYTPNPCKNDTGYGDCVFDGFGRNALEIGGDYLHEWGMGSLRIGGSYMTAEGDNSRNDPTEWAVGAALSYGGFQFGAQYAVHDTRYEDPLLDRRYNDNIDWAVSAKYTTGPTTFLVQYGQSDQGYRDYDFFWGGNYHHDNDYENFLGGVSYALGPGIEVGVTAQRIQYTNNTNAPLFNNTFESDGFGAAAFIGLRF